jgi:hypothetical protein
MHPLVLGHAADPGFLGELGGGLEDAVLDEMGLDVFGHGGCVDRLKKDWVRIIPKMKKKGRF